MYAFATWTGGNKYDVLVWESEELSINDDGARATARQTVTVGDDITESIRLAMGLTSNDEIEIN